MVTFVQAVTLRQGRFQEFASNGRCLQDRLTEGRTGTRWVQNLSYPSQGQRPMTRASSLRRTGVVLPFFEARRRSVALCDKVKNLRGSRLWREAHHHFVNRRELPRDCHASLSSRGTVSTGFRPGCPGRSTTRRDVRADGRANEVDERRSKEFTSDERRCAAHCGACGTVEVDDGQYEEARLRR